ncbi:MAG: hypothetical protein LBU65_08380 [Planctomycetaceae bacterium]|jgi:hypothetical protein|nr:hypothetical protein [Planctomycetaceae bacterium]
MIENFDAVEMIREIRTKLYNEIKDMPRDEQIKHIRERTLIAVAEHEEWRKNYYAEQNKAASENLSIESESRLVKQA